MPPRVTPAVAAAANAHHVDVNHITGTGAGGRITVGDVRAAAGLPRQLPQPTPRAVPVAARASRGPYLFTAGELPPFTASGLSPDVLLQVPAAARPAMAAASTTADAYAILTRFDGLAPDAADAVAAAIGWQHDMEHLANAWPTAD